VRLAHDCDTVPGTIGRIMDFTSSRRPDGPIVADVTV
jgi:hypothetical protein